MGGYGWGDENGECFERGDHEVGGGIGIEEWLVWKMAGGCDVGGKTGGRFWGEWFGKGRSICLRQAEGWLSSLVGRRLGWGLRGWVRDESRL